MSASERTPPRSLVSLRSSGALAVLAGVLAISSAPAAHAHLARPAPAAKLPAYGTLWITSPSLSSVLEFAPPNASISQTPIATIVGANTELNQPMGMAMDHRARLWVANFSTNAILVFAAHANGNVKPESTISGAKTGLNEPIAVALTQKGDVWVADSGSSTLTEFASSANGNVAPIRTIAGSNTTLANLSGIAVSPDGKRVWVSERRPSTAPVPPSLVEFSGTAHGNVKPLAQISGSSTQLNGPSGIAVGVSGNDPIAVNDNREHPQAILRFAPGAHGNVKPTVVKGTNTGLSEPQLPALDAVGNLWVPNVLNDEVNRYDADEHGDVGPQKEFLATGLNGPASIAVFIVPPSAPHAPRAHATKTKLHLTWSAPSLKGGGILGYEVRAHKNGGHWKVIKTTTKPSYTKSHPHKGYSYDVIAFNEAGYSTPSKAIKPTV